LPRLPVSDVLLSRTAMLAFMHGSTMMSVTPCFRRAAPKPCPASVAIGRMVQLRTGEVDIRASASEEAIRSSRRGSRRIPFRACSIRAPNESAPMFCPVVDDDTLNWHWYDANFVSQVPFVIPSMSLCPYR
jgi:hypothetical protein